MQTQWRTTGFGLVGLDYQAVSQMAEQLKIPLTTCNFKKIQALERVVLNKQAEKDAGD